MLEDSQKTDKGATKLIVRVPSYVHHDLKEIITIMAVNSDGQVDKTRNDEIELMLTPLYRLDDSKVRLQSNLVKLVNGEATVDITSEESEFVKIEASCKDKNAGLEPYSVLLATGGFPFHR
jgi:dissimilatory sulfite reductase (desulfoviridin) alpha/beta subunit